MKNKQMFDKMTRSQIMVCAAAESNCVDEVQKSANIACACVLLDEPYPLYPGKDRVRYEFVWELLRQSARAAEDFSTKGILYMAADVIQRHIVKMWAIWG